MPQREKTGSESVAWSKPLQRVGQKLLVAAVSHPNKQDFGVLSYPDVMCDGMGVAVNNHHGLCMNVDEHFMPERP